MSRRFRSKRYLATRTPMRKLVSFQLGNERYAISIDRVQHVINEFTPHGVLHSGRSLVEYKNEIITLIDPAKIFISSHDERERQYLIICTLKEGQRIGIPIPEIPTVLEIAEDKFGKIPELYQQGNLSSAIQNIIQITNDKIMFYLDLEELVNQLVIID
ncbi:chemotaxis protein CheW [Argonema galeatum]|uniref:chemotaxis protein CheW n=1 Tax=Argonema galeatum TaxID=2942762 RepID=UPI002011EA1E|nr:chemotaxis protein CheW [Argonema galeatum]MCL1465422.1 chemotaxis protein CheW [Argonema galeatum A003/A1]